MTVVSKQVFYCFTYYIEVKISINIITCVDYIHKQSVVYRGINGKHVKIDGHLNVYLTNFT